MKAINSDMLLMGAIVVVAACCVAACLRAPAKLAPLGVEREDAAAMSAGAFCSSSSLGKSCDPADKAPDGCASSFKAKIAGLGVLLIVLIVAVVALKERFFLFNPLILIHHMPPSFVVLGPFREVTGTSDASTCARVGGRMPAGARPQAWPSHDFLKGDETPRKRPSPFKR